MLQLKLLETVGEQIDEEANPSASDFVLRGWAWYYRPISERQLREAQHSFEKALKLDPVSVDARVGIAQILMESLTTGRSASPQEDTSRAEALLSEALDLNRNAFRLHFALGLLRRVQGRLEDSRIELEQELTLDRNNAGALLQLGATLLWLGQPDTALPQFEQALWLTEGSQNLHYFHLGLGICHLLLDRVDEAVEHLRRANAQHTQLWHIPLYYAAALALKGQLESAKRALADLRELKPELDSLSAVRKSPTYTAQSSELHEKTLMVGLRIAGMAE